MNILKHPQYFLLMIEENSAKLVLFKEIHFHGLLITKWQEKRWIIYWYKILMKWGSWVDGVSVLVLCTLYSVVGLYLRFSVLSLVWQRYYTEVAGCSHSPTISCLPWPVLPATSQPVQVGQKTALSHSLYLSPPTTPALPSCSDTQNASPAV